MNSFRRGHSNPPSFSCIILCLSYIIDTMDKKIVEEQIDYWLKSARHDLKTAESLFENKHYDMYKEIY